MQVLLSPLWTPIGVVATILIGYFTLRPRRKKSLSYDVTFNEKIVSSAQGILDGIEIRYHGTQVNDVRMIVIRIWNSGTVPILRSDFDKPIYIPLNGKLLSASITRSTPPELLREVVDKARTYPEHDDVQQSGIELHPLLLNAHDSVTIQAVVADSDGSVDVQARIAGIPSIDRHDASRRVVSSRKMDVVISSLLLAVWTLPAIVVLVAFPHPPLDVTNLLSAFAPTIALALLLAMRVWLLLSAQEKMREAHASTKNRLQRNGSGDTAAHSDDE